MRKFNYAALIMLFTFLLASPYVTFARGDKKANKKAKTSRLQKVTANPSNTILDINNITSWIDGSGFMQPLVGSSWNGTFPKGTDGVIYQEGIVWGGQVHDGGSELIRVGGNTYSNGTTALDRVYRVRPDYKTADLTDDAANFNFESIENVTQAQIDQIRQQYEIDWNNWPADKGAPYNDVNKDGKYEPDVDIPGIPNAGQTIWLQYDDRNSSDVYGSDPIGIQVNETLWGYASSGPLGDVTFKKVDIIYKGTASSAAGSHIDSMYITQWSDPDVGNSTDDFAGCDTTLNLGYAYNSTSTDIDYAALGLAVPAGGYDFLQGVAKYTGNPNDSAIVNLKWRHGYKYVNSKPMSGFEYFAAGGTWEDPDLGDYNGSLQWYNLQRGYLPRPYYPSAQLFPSDVVDYTANGTFLVDGDPVAGTGKLDGAVDASGDRRIMVNNGPFTMNLGDTAEVVVALVGGMGKNNISSVAVLKYNDTFAQFAFDRLFNIPQIQKVDVKTVASNQQVVLDWGENYTRIDELENQSHAGYEFEGYNVYQLPTASSALSDGYLVATYDKVDLVKVIFDDVFDQNSGFVISKPVVFGGDFGVKRSITINQDYINGTPLRNGQNYYYAVTVYAYSMAPGVAFHVLESQPTVVSIMPHAPDPGVTNPDIGAFSESQNIQHDGTANATVAINVIDPSSVTGHQYKLYFHNETYTLGADATWTDITAASKKLRKTADLTGSNLTSTVAWGETKGTMDIHYLVDVESPNYDYCDGVKITLPAGVIVDKLYKPISNNTGGEIPYTFDQATNSIFYGEISLDSLVHGDTTNRSTNGVFAGGEDIMITVHPLTLPIIANYTMYDDNWGDMNGYYGGLIDVSGTDTLKGPIVNKVVTQRQWDIMDETTGNIVVKNQTIYSGKDIYTPDVYYPSHLINGPGGSSGNKNTNVGVGANVIFDGIQVAVTGSYNAPTTIASKAQANVTLNGKALSFSSGGYWINSNYIFTDFTYFGFSDGTAAASDPSYGGSGGVPLSDVTDLQQDYELRFTGVLGDTTINGVTIEYTKSGGQLATLIGASGYSIADHPLNPTPGAKAPFNVRIPFEVWNVTKNEQVNLMFWDRSGDPTKTGGKVWNTDNRVYAWVINTKYDPSTVIDPTSTIVADSATWNWVIYQSTFTRGDVIKIEYANPIQIGKDTFTFSVPKTQYNNNKALQDVKKINVFPNPYYGYQSRETARSDHYVTFSHLPAKAIIRIFDLSGVLVKTINKNDLSQFTTWNLQNDNNYPVASGIYVVYIDMPDVGTTKVLKLAIIQEEQILNVY